MYLIPIPGDNSVEDCLLSFVHGSTSTSWTASKMFLPTLGKQLKTSNILETSRIAEKLCTVSLNWNPCPRGNPGSRCQCWLAIKGDDSQVEGSANMHWNVDTSYHHLLNVIFWPEVSLTWVYVQKQKEAAFGPEDLSNIAYSKPLDNVLIVHTFSSQSNVMSYSVPSSTLFTVHWSGIIFDKILTLHVCWIECLFGIWHALKMTTSAAINRGKPFRKPSYTSEDMMDHFDKKEVISGTGGHEGIWAYTRTSCHSVDSLIW